MESDDPRAWLEDARRAHRAGDAATALAGYVRVLEQVPRAAEVLQLAAMAASQCGELETAEQLARRALDVRGDDAARLTLGRVLLQAGNPDAALAYLSSIGGETRLAADASYHMGQALRQLDRMADAERALEKATRGAPDHAPAWNELGVARLQQGRADTAAPCFERSLRIRPGHAATLTNLATARFELGDNQGCERAIAETLVAWPGHRAAEALLGRLRKGQGLLQEARRIWQSLVDNDRDDAQAWHGLGSTLQAAGDYRAAGRAYDTALALDPGQPDLVAARAEWLEWQGRYQEGLEALSDLDPEAQRSPGPALVAARLQRRVGRSDLARAALETALPAVGGNTPLRRQYCFTLGDVCDDLSDFPAAWRWYEEGNCLTHGSYDGAAHRRWLRSIEERCPAASRNDAGSGVLFIVGMPRSGTSLIEQILAAHPSVQAAGELPALGELVQSMLSAGDGSSDAITEIGQRYLEALPTPGPGQTVVTDKMPTNFLYLPVIHAALPGARVVHCRRDPRDSGLSCFCTDFIDPALAFATRLDWLADYIRAYLDVMARWLPRFAGSALELDYERLANSPEQEVRKLLAFLHLDWDDACLRFHEQERVATTASHAQVREPVHTRSIGRWRHYQAHLGSLLDVRPTDRM